MKIKKLIYHIILGISSIIINFQTAALAKPSCDFRGISIGDQLSQREIMEKLGFPKFILNPDLSLFEINGQPKEKIATILKDDGMFMAREELEMSVGPYCNENSCVVPAGINIGNNIPAYVYIAFDGKSKIKAIDLSFSYFNWGDVSELVRRKYGSNWEVNERDDFVLELKTKNITPVHITNIEYKELGTNGDTKCKIFGESVGFLFAYPKSVYGTIHGGFAIEKAYDDF
jgi:hypothetical protein